jgi:hypothetical protein
MSELWNQFFHAPEPVDTVAFFRILLGVIVAVDAALRLGGNPELLLGPQGLFPASGDRAIAGRRSLDIFDFLPETDESVLWVLRALLIAGLCLAAGFCSRLSAAAVFFLLTSIHHRNMAAVHSGDVVVRLMSLLLIFSHAGGRYSLDSWLAGRAQDASDPWCTRLLQLQVSIIYFYSVAWKRRGEMWANGSAVYYVLQLDSYRRLRVPPRLAALVSKPATWATLGIEFALATLVWLKPLRPGVLAAGVLLHLGIELVMNVQLFEWTMLACLALFLDPLVVRRLFGG